MVHLERMILHVLWVTAMLAIGARGFLFRRTDCQVSDWSSWSKPFGFGQVSRERAILRHPSNGGSPCPPDMEEIKMTGQRVSIQSTAKSITSNFMVQNSQANSLSVGFVRDLLVIVDGSGSIGASDFNDAKNQLARLLGMLCPEPDPFKTRRKVHQQAALIEFSTTVREIFDFNDKANTVAVQQGIIGMPYLSGQTCTATAFNYARSTMFTASKGMRSQPNVKKDVLILTDGNSNCGGDAVQAAKLLGKTANVYGLIIGGQDDASIQELTDYVSSPKDQHLFTVEDAHDHLEQLVTLVEQELKSIPCQSFDI
ncbi:collagen alpha-3(VI) chain-like [Mya arenaria]|nr:collagen alpha-3(VI) chain-like [Mya arenaria]